MFNRRAFTSPVQWSALASLTAMIALNIFALSQQLEMPRAMAAPVALEEVYLA